jgi:SAM-dependent methyltransferase
MPARYDLIGQQYSTGRKSDPRIEALVHAQLTHAASVLNVGAGTGSYEPLSLSGISIEPSTTMIRQRKPDNFPVVQGQAENLPFPNKSFDAVMGVMTIHHWSDVAQGLKELKRVARNTIVLMTHDPNHDGFWLDHYLPDRRLLDQHEMPPIQSITKILGACQILPVPIPFDCHDGFYGAYWRRPEAYLNPNVRRNISLFARLQDTEGAMNRLSNDLATGCWHQQFGHLKNLTFLDLGYRLVVSRLA